MYEASIPSLSLSSTPLYFAWSSIAIQKLRYNSTDVTGPATASKALIYVYDIFGYFPQSLQGADILATSGKDHSYQVFMPDFLEGNPADIAWYPPDNAQKGAALGNFFKNQGAPPKTAGRIPGLVKEIEKKYSSINTWGVVGFCWGGKIVSLVTSQSDTAFKAGAECHPAMVDPADAEGIKIPLCMLASKDEAEEDVKKFEANLKGEKHVEIFKDQIHGVRILSGQILPDWPIANYRILVVDGG
jgi:dienelactone hydrolase